MTMTVHLISNNGKDAERENIHMYRIVSTNSFIDGRKFDNLAAAKSYADQRIERGDICCDVHRVTDGRCVYSA
jgi:hypothetical protein